MDFANERYVRLYVRDTVTWKRLQWDGQNALTQLLRKADRAGVVDLGGIEPWEALTVLCGAPEAAARAGVARAIELGCVVLDGDRLVFPRFIEANETAMSDRQRAKDSRDRRAALSRNVTPPSQDVSPTSHDVTPRHAASHRVTLRCAVPATPSVLRRALPDPGARTEEQSSCRIGNDFMLAVNASLTWDFGSWKRELELIGDKPESQRATALTTILDSRWCQANAHAVNPGHVVKYWPKYASGKEALTQVVSRRGATAVPSQSDYAADAAMGDTAWETSKD